jgi:protein subunit release factor A
MSEAGFWDNQAESAKVLKQLKSLKSLVEPWEIAFKKSRELAELSAILKEEDSELAASAKKEIDALSSELEALEFLRQMPVISTVSNWLRSQLRLLIS